MTDPIRRAASWMTDADRMDLDACGFNAEDIRDIEACLSPRPQRHDKPTCVGRWVSDGGLVVYCRDDRDCEFYGSLGCVWYGPIPEPPKEGAAT